MLSTEELLKPRWKVIAEWPYMGAKYSIGKIIQIEGTEKFKYENNFYDKYPHLFKKMEWWEEREEKDMPEYLKYYEGENLEFVLKVEKYRPHTSDSGIKVFWSFEYLWRDEPDIKRMSLRGWLPATREEHEQYLSQQTNK